MDVLSPKERIATYLSTVSERKVRSDHWPERWRRHRPPDVKSKWCGGGGDHRENNTVPYWQDEKCKERRRMK